MKVRVSRNLFVIVGLDIALLFLSFYLAHLVRFDFEIPQKIWETCAGLLPYVIAVKLGCFYYFDLYRGMWRYTGLNDLLNVIKAAAVSSVVLVLFVLWRYRFEGISRSVFLIDFCFTLIFVSGLRISTRIAFEKFSSTMDIRELFQTVWGHRHPRCRVAGRRLLAASRRRAAGQTSGVDPPRPGPRALSRSQPPQCEAARQSQCSLRKTVEKRGGPVLADRY